MPLASQNTDAMTFPADGTDLLSFGAEQPASVRCFDCWCVMVNPSLIRSNKSTRKISFIFVKTLRALFRYLNVSAFVICCEQARHPSCAELFHIRFFMQNISYTFFWNVYSLLSNFTHFHSLIIQYHITHLFNDFWWWCTFWTSFTWIIFKAGTVMFKLGSPFLIVENEGEESP